MIATGVPRPDNLTGTNGEAALHFNAAVTVASPTSQTIFGEQAQEIFITSQSLLLYQSTNDTLVTIAYPSIILHAASSTPIALYLQIEDDELGSELLSDANWSGGMFELFVSPTSEERTEVNDMFAALSVCASMHPDPANEESASVNDNSFMQQMSDPSHQWITSDNAGQFDDAPEAQEMNGNHEEEAPRKSRRTS